MRLDLLANIIVAMGNENCFPKCTKGKYKVICSDSLCQPEYIGGRKDLAKPIYRTSTDSNKAARFLIRNDDILVQSESQDGKRWLGRSRRVKTNGLFLAGRGVIIVRPKKEMIDPGLLAVKLSSDAFVEDMVENSFRLYGILFKIKIDLVRGFQVNLHLKEMSNVKRDNSFLILSSKTGLRF